MTWIKIAKTANRDHMNRNFYVNRNKRHIDRWGLETSKLHINHRLNSMRKSNTTLQCPQTLKKKETFTETQSNFDTNERKFGLIKLKKILHQKTQITKIVKKILKSQSLWSQRKTTHRRSHPMQWDRDRIPNQTETEENKQSTEWNGM